MPTYFLFFLFRFCGVAIYQNGPMKRKALTDKLIKSLKPEAAEYMVTGNDGFYVRVLPSGIRTFWYRFTLNGKRQKMNLGQYPEVSMAEANDRNTRPRPNTSP